MDDDRTWCGDDLDGAAERFMERVDMRGSDECWPWTGAAARGRGVAKLAGARQQTTAPRVAYMLATGRPIPPGLLVRHSCDVPACCNPRHLLLGTHLDNSRDMVQRGRHRNNVTGTLVPSETTVRVPERTRRELYGA